MSAQILNLQYFDDGKGTWGLRRPKNVQPLHQGDRPSYTVVHLNLGINSQLSPEDRVKALVNQYLSSSEPTFITLTEVTNEISGALAKNSWIRGHYAMTDTVFCVGPALTEASGPEAQEMEIEQACIILIKHGINVDFVESLARQFAGNTTDNEPQPVVAIHMRNFMGLGFHTFCTLHTDPSTDVKPRMAYLAPILERLSEKDNVIIGGNFYQATAVVKEFKGKLNWEKDRTGFIDVTDSPNCTKALNHNPQETSIWYRSKDSRLTVDKVQLLSLDNNAPDVYQSAVVCKFTLNSGYGKPGAAQQPQPPQTVSASPQGSQQQQFADPAVVGVNRSGTTTPNAPGARYAAGGDGGVNLANLFGKAGGNTATAPTAPAVGAGVIGGGVPPIVRQWTAANILAMNRRANLTDAEREMDLSSKFNSVGQAVEQLNSGAFPWNRDYAVVHSTLLACSTARCSMESFRKYSLTPVMAGSPAQVTPGSRASVGAVTPSSVLSAVRHSFQSAGQSPEPARIGYGIGAVAGGADRPRSWTSASAVLVHQVTPKEMVFDISADIGLGPGSLKRAVDKLNSASSGRPPLIQQPGAEKVKDRLAHYRYDYALLFNRERGAYWLLACSDVPCDIHACRQSVTLTPSLQPL